MPGAAPRAATAGRPQGDRRHAERLPPQHTPWRRWALLRPGRAVLLINLSGGGALIESRNRLSPGVRTELQLTGHLPRTIGGRIDRSRITSLNPLRFEGAIVFDQHLEWPVGSVDAADASE